MIYKKGDIVTIVDKYTHKPMKVIVRLPIQIGYRQMYRVMRIDLIGEKESKQFIIKSEDIL